MDFQEFNDLFHRKDENVIHLKYTDLDDEKDDREYDGRKNKIFDLDSSGQSIQEEVCMNDIIRKVLRGDQFNNEDNNADFSEVTHDDNKSVRRSQKRRNYIDGNSNEFISEINGEISPQENQMLVSRKNIGTFHDECDKQQIKQIIHEMHNPQERLKMCLIDTKQQSIEDIMKDINEANHTQNPHARQATYHQRRNRYQTVIELPHQFQLMMQHNQQQQELMKQSELIHEKNIQNRSIRQISNHSNSNNLTSQSSMHTLNNPNEKDKLESGDKGVSTNANYPQDKAIIKVNTQQFNINLKMVKSQEEIENKGVTTMINNNNQQNPQNQLIPQEQVQHRMQFNRGESRANSQNRKTIKSEFQVDSQMTVSMRIDHVGEDTSHNIPLFKLNNTTYSEIPEIKNEGGDTGNNKSIRNINPKLFYKATSIIYKASHEDLEEYTNGEQRLQTPFLGQQIDSNDKMTASIYEATNENNNNNNNNNINNIINNNINKNSTNNHKNNKSNVSPYSRDPNSLGLRANGDKSMQELYVNDLAQHDQPEIFRKRAKSKATTELQTPHLNADQMNYHRRQSSLDPNLVRQSYPTASASHYIKQEQKIPSQINKSSEHSQSQSLNSSITPKQLNNIQASQNEESEKMDKILISLGQFKDNNINDQQAKYISNKMRQFRSNTVLYDQEKKMIIYKKLEEMSTNHNHIIYNDQPQDGCVACEFQQLMKQANITKDKLPDQDIIDTNKLFKEVPLHVIESRFFLRQISMLKQENEEVDNNDRVFVLGNKNNPDLKPLRVYFFGREDTFIDFEINNNKTTVATFVKFAIQSYKQKGNINQALLKYPDQPSRYKIYPNSGERPQDRFKPILDIPEPSDNMMMAEVIEDSSGNICCFVEVDEFMESISMSHNIENDPEQDLREFQSVYSKSGQFVFRVECKEKEYYTFIRIDKEKLVDDIFEDLQKKKKIDIDKRNYMILGKIFGQDNPVELDLKMPLNIIDDHCLRINRREYEDRQGGTVDDNQIAAATNNNLFNYYTNGQDDSMDQGDDHFDGDYGDMDSQTQLNLISTIPTALDQVQMLKYEEFEIFKVTYIKNEVFKKSQRIIGIDENFIYNRKVQPKLFSLRGLLCFLFPASPFDTKCPIKKIDDIKYMCIIEGGNLLIQFNQKDEIKQWLLYNPDPLVSKRMYQKLSFLRRTTEVRVP